MAGPAGISSANATVVTDYYYLIAKCNNTLDGGLDYDPNDPDYSTAITNINNSAQTFWDTMDKSAGRTYIWAEYPNNLDMLNVQYTYSRLKAMALAYETRGAALYQNHAMAVDIINAMDWIYANWYNTTGNPDSDWFARQIGVPTGILETIVLLYDVPEMTTARKNLYLASAEYNTHDTFRDAAGANRACEAYIYILMGMLEKNETWINYAVNTGMPPLLAYQTSVGQSGFFYDGSFMEHSYHAYNGGYGEGCYNAILNVVNLMEGSHWPITDPNKYNLVKWAKDAYIPLVYKGAILDNVRGRSISEFFLTDHSVGHLVINDLARAAELANAADALLIKRQIKEWIQKDIYISYYPYADMVSITKVKAIMNDSSITPSGDQQNYRQYPIMDRAVINRPGYSFGLSMNDWTCWNYESILDENLKGWHQGDGMTQLYTANELDQYINYWQTVDSYRLPGTTAEYQTAIPHRTSSTTDWCGGATDGVYGISGMYLHMSGQPLYAKKSWFMFDDEIVCLGSDISTTSGKVVETTVENRKLNASGSNTLTVNGAAKPSGLGWSETMTGVRSIHLQGNAANSDIGYYFPVSTTVKGLREARTGTWYDINHLNGCYTTDPYTSNFMTLWLDHGANPASGSYKYVILPNYTSAQTTAYRNSPEIVICKQDSNVHAVKDNTIGVTMANFWNDVTASFSVGTYTNVVTSSGKASFFMHETTTGSSNYLEFAVADPTKCNMGSVSFEIKLPSTSLVYADPGVTVTQYGSTLKFSVNFLQGNPGQSYKLKVLE